MDANSGCCSCFGSHQRATAWAAASGLVQAIILLPLSILALLKQLWNVETPLPSVPALLYVYYFYNPNGDIAKEANGLAFRTQIVASIYTILSSLWLILSIALLINTNRWSRGSPWAHFTCGVIMSAMILADFVATVLYSRDILSITDYDVLSKETGYPIAHDETVPRTTFVYAPLIMIVIFSKGVILWLFNIFFAVNVFIAGQHYARKEAPHQDLNRNEENTKESMTDPQIPIPYPAASIVPFSQSSVLADVKRSTIPEHSEGMQMINEGMTSRRQPDSTDYRDRVERSFASPRFPRLYSESASRSSSRQSTPEVILNKNVSSFSYTQGPLPQTPRSRQCDAGPRSPFATESQSTWMESPQSPLWRDFQSDTWWVPSKDGHLHRQTQPTRAPVSELRAQLPWSYFQAPLELDSIALESTPSSSKRAADMSQQMPSIPVPDYTLHFQRGRHRSSTKELREISPKAVARSASDVGKRLPGGGGAKDIRSRNVYGAPFDITGATSSPHLLRRPTQLAR